MPEKMKFGVESAVTLLPEIKVRGGGRGREYRSVVRRGVLAPVCMHWCSAWSAKVRVYSVGMC